MIEFRCPHCGNLIQVGDEAAGRKGNCHGCGKMIQVPKAGVQETRARAETLKRTGEIVDAPHPQPPELPTNGEHEEGHLIRNVGIGVIAVTAVVCVAIVVLYATRDRWEVLNRAQVSARLKEAKRTAEADPLAAYKIYDEVLKEAQQHKITDERFSAELAAAEEARAALHKKVEEELRAEEAEKQRQAEEEARRAAEEKKRLAEEAAKERAAKEAQRIAEEKEKAEEERLKAAALAYRKAPESARTALNVLKKLEARTEVGINYADYSRGVGEAWAEVKIFVESPEAPQLPEFNFLLVSATEKYKLGLDAWRGKFEPERNLRYHDALSDVVLQECWRAASRRLEAAQSLISEDDATTVLSRVKAWRDMETTYEETVRSLFPTLVLLQFREQLLSQLLSLQSESREKKEKLLKEHEKEIKEVTDKLIDLARSDTQAP